MSLSRRIQEYAQELGFELVGILPVEPARTIDAYERWLASGHAAEMGYLERHLPLKRDPRAVFPNARTFICLAKNYHTRDIPDELRQDPLRGLISRYAWRSDYHDVLRARLDQLLKFIQDEIPCNGRICVDSAPILEREYAHRAGLGWFGKNTMLIHWRLGSWLFLCELLLDVDMPTEVLPPRGSCGTCTRCIEACPTDAILPDLTLDSRRCISYLTIELKGTIPHQLRPQMGNWIFGCDICQEVCPWNRRAPATEDREFQPRRSLFAPKLSKFLGLSKERFREVFRTSPILRTKRRGLLRNVAVALGNSGSEEGIPALQLALRDEEPMVRAHAAWALGQVGGRKARRTLDRARNTEVDEGVRAEIDRALYHDASADSIP